MHEESEIYWIFNIVIYTKACVSPACEILKMEIWTNSKKILYFETLCELSRQKQIKSSFIAKVCFIKWT